MKKGNLIFILFLLGGCSWGENTLSISSGFFHSCRIEKWEDGNRLLCWGRNIEGELGKGDYLPSPEYIYTNEEIRIEGIWDSVYSVSTGGYHTCGIDDDNKLWCWGRNDYGQVGDGENGNKNLPQMVSDKKWKSVSAGGYHTCAIDDDNKLWCWGRNDYGQVGDGGNENKNLPLMVSDKKWKSVSAGGYHTCAIDDDNKLWCWGRNDYGQVGDGENENKNLPQMISDKKWKSVSAGGYHTCGIDDDNKLWCWGRNDYGQVGDGGNENKNLPQMISDKKWKSVSAGGYHTCAIDDDNKLWCWGRNDYGQVGDESFGNRNMPVMVSPQGVKDKWILISAGGYHTCGVIEEKRKVYCWGANSAGQLGINSKIDIKSSPVQVGKHRDWVFVSTSLTFNCGIKEDGTLWCWGLFLCKPTAEPKRIGNESDWISVGTWIDSAFAIKKDKTLWHIKANYNKNSCSESPVQISTDRDWIFTNFGIHIKEDGSAWMFNSEKGFQKIGKDWRKLSFPGLEWNDDWGYGIKNDGTLWFFWIDEPPFWLEEDSYPDKEIEIGSDDEWEVVDRGYAIKKDGSLWEIKIDPYSHTISSFRVGEEEWKEVASSTVFLNLTTTITHIKYTCGIKKEDGTLWEWSIEKRDDGGMNPTPMTILSKDRWRSLSNGSGVMSYPYKQACGIKEDKTLWCWGDNTFGFLGIGPPEEE
jgi:alpha-tubulin suppressor-like RCC1 family protein